MKPFHAEVDDVIVNTVETGGATIVIIDLTDGGNARLTPMQALKLSTTLAEAAGHAIAANRLTAILRNPDD